MLLGWPTVERRKLKQRLLNRAVVINMNGILEHVVYKVRIGFDKVIKSRQDLEVLSLFLVKEVEANFVLIQLHLVDGNL
jgi:hypothetical protein